MRVGIIRKVVTKILPGQLFSSALCTGQKFQREQEIIHFELNVKNDGAQVV
jgi:hypothetical protein